MSTTRSPVPEVQTYLWSWQKEKWFSPFLSPVSFTEPTRQQANQIWAPPSNEGKRLLSCILPHLHNPPAKAGVNRSCNLACCCCCMGRQKTQLEPEPQLNAQGCQVEKQKHLFTTKPHVFNIKITTAQRSVFYHQFSEESCKFCNEHALNPQ